MQTFANAALNFIIRGGVEAAFTTRTDLIIDAHEIK